MDVRCTVPAGLSENSHGHISFMTIDVATLPSSLCSLAGAEHVNSPEIRAY